MSKTTYIYTDGACLNNGKFNAKAGFGIFFSDNSEHNVSERVIGKQSNNTAEITAIIRALNIIKEKNIEGKVIIYTDSKYCIMAATSYGKKNDALGWSKDIPNLELVKTLYTMYKDMNNVSIRYIKAHTGKEDTHSYGNEKADQLANSSLSSSNTIPIPANIVPKTNYKSNINTTSNTDKKKVQIKNIDNDVIKIYINVQYSNKNIIKKLGGKWDSDKKKWYILPSNPEKTTILKLFTLSPT